MVRTRFAVMAFAVGLGLLSGCSSLSRINPFHRHPDACPCEGSMYDGDGPLSTDGPSLGDFPDGLTPPAPVVPPGGVSTVPPGGVSTVPPGGISTVPPGGVSTVPPGQVPPLGPPPRLFAQPQTAPATPIP